MMALRCCLLVSVILVAAATRMTRTMMALRCCLLVSVILVAAGLRTDMEVEDLEAMGTLPKEPELPDEGPEVFLEEGLEEATLQATESDYANHKNICDGLRTCKDYGACRLHQCRRCCQGPKREATGA